MIESGDKEYYGFSYKDCDGKVHEAKFSADDDNFTTWHEVMNDFVNFLSNVYGYDIKSQVRVEAPWWLQHDPQRGLKEGWQGEYFVKEEDVETDDEYSAGLDD